MKQMVGIAKMRRS